MVFLLFIRPKKQQSRALLLFLVLCRKNFTSFTTTSCKNTTSVFSWHTVTESVFTLTTDFTWLISTFHVEYLLLDFRIRLAGYIWSVTKHTILFYSNRWCLSRCSFYFLKSFREYCLLKSTKHLNIGDGTLFQAT